MCKKWRRIIVEPKKSGWWMQPWTVVKTGGNVKETEHSEWITLSRYSDILFMF